MVPNYPANLNPVIKGCNCNITACDCVTDTTPYRWGDVPSLPEVQSFKEPRYRRRGQKKGFNN